MISGQSSNNRLETAMNRPLVGIPIAWYKAQILESPTKSIREGASSFLGRGPESLVNVSISSKASPDFHAASALGQETILRLSSGPALAPKDHLLLPVSIRGKSQNSGLAPGNRIPNPWFTLWHKIITCENLLWNDYSCKITNFTCNSVKSVSFPDNLRAQNPSRIAQKPILGNYCRNSFVTFVSERTLLWLFFLGGGGGT